MDKEEGVPLQESKAVYGFLRRDPSWSRLSQSHSSPRSELIYQDLVSPLSVDKVYRHMRTEENVITSNYILATRYSSLGPGGPRSTSR